MGLLILDDDESEKRFAKAQHLIAKGDYIKALEIIEDLMLVNDVDKELLLLRAVEGDTFLKLEDQTENFDLKFVYMLASVACYSEDASLLHYYARGLFNLGEQIRSELYFKKCVEIAEKCLSLPKGKITEEAKQEAENYIEKAKLRIEDLNKSAIQMKDEPEVSEPKKILPDLSENDTIKRLKSFWMGLAKKRKKNFMKVSIAELKRFVKGAYNKEGLDIMEEVLTSAKEDSRTWRFWMCRTVCSKKFFSAEECKKHLQEEHGANVKLCSEEHRVKRIGDDWARKISVEPWEPVNTVLAVEMINNQLPYVKDFMSKSKKNGWSKNWPTADDEERSKLLEDIRSLLVSLSTLDILSSSILDWLMYLPQKHLAKLAVSEQSLVDSLLIETPQSICFLECNELNQIQSYLSKIKRESEDGTDLICRAADSFWETTRVKEKIDFDRQFSVLLLDIRLWKDSNAPFDDEGTINFFDPDGHYAATHSQGDDFISWLVDHSSVDKSFPRPIRQHNLDIWLAVLRAVKFTCKALESNYEKKIQVFHYDEAMTAIDDLCRSEDERRKNLQKDKWNSYASLLRNKCEEKINKGEHSLSAKIFLYVVLDTFEEREQPAFDSYPSLEACMSVIRKRKSPSDDVVLKTIDHLKFVINDEVPQIDSKILLIDNSRIRLVDSLTKLSIIDNRTYMLQMLKPFLLEKVKSDAAGADLLYEEKKSKAKNQNNNKKKNKNKIVSPQDLDETVEIEPAEISSKTDNQEESTKGMQNMTLGEASLEPTLGGYVARYNSALDMTLKALFNINVLKKDLKRNEQLCHNNREDKVPSAIEKLFTAFRSEKGDYSFLLSDLIAYLEEASPLSSDAAEVLVTIIESWRNSERESLVTRLFTLVENENLSCSECRRKSNRPEQSSYCIVMSAYSIRYLKCAVGHIKFVDILKLVHHNMTKRPRIFTIVLQWEKDETENEICETTNALEVEIDMSRLYKGLKPNTNYQLVSMVGYGVKDEQHICLAYEEKQWFNLKGESFEKEYVGGWESVVRLFKELNVRPEILFYEVA